MRFPSLALVLGALLGATGVLAQSYPSKTIRIITSSPGGATDIMARLIAPTLAGTLGQSVIVENQGGSGGLLAGRTVARSTPDGHTLLVHTSTVWVGPLMRTEATYDTMKDLEPITLAANPPNMLIVHPSVAAKSVSELIALIKAKPGVLNYGTGGTGASSHLAGELFKYMAGLDFVRVNYNGSSAAINAVIAGEVQMGFPSAATAAGHVKSGKVRGLAVTSQKPSLLAPDLPTVDSSGLKGYVTGVPIGLWSTGGTPAAIINRLNKEVVSALNQSKTKEKLFGTGIEIIGSSPEEFRLLIKNEIERMGAVIKKAGIKEDE